jgi:hypothetical protein
VTAYFHSYLHNWRPTPPFSFHLLNVIKLQLRRESLYFKHKRKTSCTVNNSQLIVSVCTFLLSFNSYCHSLLWSSRLHSSSIACHSGSVHGYKTIFISCFYFYPPKKDIPQKLPTHKNEIRIQCSSNNNNNYSNAVHLFSSYTSRLLLIRCSVFDVVCFYSVVHFLNLVDLVASIAEQVNGVVTLQINIRKARGSNLGSYRLFRLGLPVSSVFACGFKNSTLKQAVAVCSIAFIFLPFMTISPYIISA